MKCGILRYIGVYRCAYI